MVRWRSCRYGLEQYRNAEKYDKKQLAILEEELQKKAEALEIPKEARVSLDGLEGWAGRDPAFTDSGWVTYSREDSGWGRAWSTYWSF